MDEHDLEWRATKAGRCAGWLGVISFGLALVASAIVAVRDAASGDPDRNLGWILGAIIMLGPQALIGWRLGLHPLVRLSPRGLHARNPMRSFFVPWADLERAESGYSGLIIHRRSGPAITAWAVQKSNVAAWLTRRVRSDEVAETINRRARPEAR